VKLSLISEPPRQAWFNDRIFVSKLQQQEQEQEQQLPQYLNIPDNLNPAIDLSETLRYGVTLLKLKSDKELMVLSLQAMDLLFTARITYEYFWKAMLSDSGSHARQQVEGSSTWKGRFSNNFSVLYFLKSLHLTETDIDNLIKLLPEK
jgi:hypothetical protein